jgi:hypothetical protein
MDPELFRRMQEAALRFKSGESDFEQIMTPNGPAHLVRDPSNSLGFRVDFVGGGARHSVSLQEYPAAPGRSPGYPAPLPFLANCVAIVDTAKQSVTWYDVPDLDRSVEHIVRQCTSEGWKQEPVATAANDGEPSWVFIKDGVERTLRIVRAGAELRLVLREMRVKN